MTSRWHLRKRGERMLAGFSVSSGASAAPRRAIKCGGGVEFGVVDQPARIAAMQLDRDWRGRLRAHAPRPSLPGRGRGPRSTARSSAAIAASCAPASAPSRSSGCLSSASSVTGARPPSAASAASRANTPAGVSASASPPESSTAISSAPAPPRRGAPARGRASPARRSCLVFRPPRATRPRWRALLPRRWRLRSCASDASACVGGGVEIFRAAARLPAFGGGGRAQGFRDQQLAAVRRGRASCVTSSRAMPMRREQRLHGELRMAGGGRAVVRLVVVVAGDQRPGWRRRDRCRGRAAPRRRAAAWRWSRAAWRSPASSRSSRRRSPARRCWRAARLRPRSACRAARPASIAPCSVRMRRPGSRAIFRKSQRQLPILVELVRHQAVELVPGTCRVVMSSIRRARSSARPSAAAGVLAISGEPCAPRTAGEFAHFRISSASSSRRSSGADRLRQRRARLRRARRWRLRRNAISSSSRSPMRDDARQDRGVAFERVEEHVARQPAGAPRRQIKRGARQFERIVAWPESRAPVCRRAAPRSAPAETAPRREC